MIFRKKQILKTNVSCQMSNKIASFREEEYQFPALYDKSHSHFHRMDIKSNAWQKVAHNLEVENGEC